MNPILVFVLLIAAYAALIYLVKKGRLIEFEPAVEKLSMDSVNPNKPKRRRQVIKSYVRMV